MFLVMFLMIGALFVVSEKNINLKNEEGLKSFATGYFSWIGQTIKNIGTGTGYIIKLDWLPS